MGKTIIKKISNFGNLISEPNNIISEQAIATTTPEAKAKAASEKAIAEAKIGEIDARISGLDNQLSNVIDREKNPKASGGALTREQSCKEQAKILINKATELNNKAAICAVADKK